MMMMNVAAIAMDRSSDDLQRLANSAIKAANSHDFDGCFDVLQHMEKNLTLSAKDLRNSTSLLPLSSLRNHKNPKIRMGADLLFTSWLKILYSSSSTCNKRRSRDEEEEETGEINQIDNDRKKRRRLDLKSGVRARQNKPDDTVQVLNKTDHQRSRSIAARSVPIKLSETNPRSKAHESGKIKHKPVLPTSTTLQMKKTQACSVSTHKSVLPLKDSQNLKTKNSTEMLELFQIAKKSADVANAKGLLAAKAEASICVDSLSLLMEFPISSTATETKSIMLRLLGLTRHKDRKICHSASALLQCWKQNITDQQTLTCV